MFPDWHFARWLCAYYCLYFMLTLLLYIQINQVGTQRHICLYIQCTAWDTQCMQLFKQAIYVIHVCTLRSNDLLWNQHKSVGGLQALQLSLSLCLSCHPPYRSVYCNVKYHHTLEDIVWQFCQGSLEYFFLIAQTVAGRKWLPCEFTAACFLLMGKNNFI